MTGDDLITDMNELCVAYAKAQVAHTLADLAADREERRKHLAHAEYWDSAVSNRYRTLTESVGAALPDPVTVESFLPVQPLPTGDIAIRARDERTRPVILRLSGTQALAVGAHLTAYAAIGLDRSGGKVAGALPPIGSAPPFLTTDQPAPAVNDDVTSTATRPDTY
ncbi:hypothetical protein [Micromonospora zamorensis]|uniref:hypothetical protein n=1 Tax=Micromonospora zamorensis TaxID=709883 RepID=UPI0033BF74A5